MATPWLRAHSPHIAPMFALAPHPNDLVDLPRSTTFHLEWGALPGPGTPLGDMAQGILDRVDADGAVADVFPARPTPWAVQIAHLSRLAFFQPAQAKHNLFRTFVSTSGTRTQPIRAPTPHPTTQPQAKLLVALRVGADRYRPFPWALTWQGQGYAGLERALEGGSAEAIAQAIAAYPQVAADVAAAESGLPVLPWVTKHLHLGTAGAVERLAGGMGVAAVRATARHLGVPVQAIQNCTVRGARPTGRRTPWTPEHVSLGPTVQPRLAGAGSREGKTAEDRFTLTLQKLLTRQPCVGDPLRWIALDAKGEGLRLASFDTRDLLATRSHHAVLMEERLLLSLQQEAQHPDSG